MANKDEEGERERDRERQRKEGRKEALFFPPRVSLKATGGIFFSLLRVFAQILYCQIRISETGRDIAKVSKYSSLPG